MSGFFLGFVYLFVFPYEGNFEGTEAKFHLWLFCIADSSFTKEH